jgi:hypothetical protein
MKINVIFFISGVAIGILLLSFIGNVKDRETKYIELKRDFVLDNGSVLKSGSLLRIEKAFSEGHTRYILYLNSKGDKYTELKTFNKENLIHPYWMYVADSSFKE